MTNIHFLCLYDLFIEIEALYQHAKFNLDESLCFII